LLPTFYRALLGDSTSSTLTLRGKKLLLAILSMGTMMAKARWKLEGYKSTELVFQKELPGGYTHNEIKTLLQRLACRDLTPEEIFNSSTRRAKKAGFLTPQVSYPPNGLRTTIWLDSGIVNYVASYWKAGEPD
jgi:hypothetical protein